MAEEDGERLETTEPTVSVASAESELGLKDTVRLVTGVLIEAEDFSEVSPTLDAILLIAAIFYLNSLLSPDYIRKGNLDKVTK